MPTITVDFTGLSAAQASVAQVVLATIRSDPFVRQQLDNIVGAGTVSIRFGSTPIGADGYTQGNGTGAPSITFNLAAVSLVGDTLMLGSRPFSQVASHEVGHVLFPDLTNGSSGGS